MPLLVLSKSLRAQKGVICAGLIWVGCLLCGNSLLGLSKLPWAQRGVICARRIWGGCLVRLPPSSCVATLPTLLLEASTQTEKSNQGRKPRYVCPPSSFVAALPTCSSKPEPKQENHGKSNQGRKPRYVCPPSSCVATLPTGLWSGKFVCCVRCQCSAWVN